MSASPTSVPGASSRTPPGRHVRPPRPRATREDVARLAGVSTAVVSYVLNDGPRPVAPQTARRVREAIDLLGYRPNSSARALRRGATDLLGLVVADGQNPFFAEYTAELVRAASAVGQRLLIGESGGDRDAEVAVIDDLIARQIDGLLLGLDTVSAHRVWSRVDLPVVLINAPGPIPGRRTVAVTAEKGAREAVTHLIGVHGRRRVGMLMGDAGFGDPDPRVTGWERALAAAGQARGPLVRVPFTRAAGYAGGQALLDADPRPDAIFASSDQQAFGLLRAVHERGLSIPDDVAIVTFDGTEQTGYSWPPLTVVRQPLPEMAAAAVRLARAAPDADLHVSIPTTLVLRATCGCSDPTIH